MVRRRTAFVLLVVALVIAALWARGTHEADPAAQAPDGSTASRTAWGFGDSVDDAELAPHLQWMSATSAIAGTVRELERPLAGAQVCAWMRDDEAPSELGREPRCTTTGADGTYRIEALRAGVHQLHASAPRHIPAVWRDALGSADIRVAPGEARAGIDLELAPGGVEVRGVVKDATGGEVEGALVLATQVETLDVTRSNERGEFALWVEPGHVLLVASATGYTDGWRDGTAPGTWFELTVVPESVVVGRCVEAGSGAPVPNARVSLGRDGVAFTDDDGRFRVERVRPGRYDLTARSPDRYGVGEHSVVVALGETSDELVIAMHEATTVSGTVHVGTPEGPGCASGTVRLRDRRPEGAGFMGTTRSDGRVDVLGVLAGTYEVTVECAGFLADRTQPDLVVDSAGVAAQAWTVSEGLVIRGRVVGQDGDPVAAAGVRAVPVGSSATQTYGWDRADRDGGFEIRGLVPGTYQLTAEARGFVSSQPTELVLAEDRVPAIELELSRGGRVTGRVVDARGETVAGAEVAATGTRENRNARVLARDDGTFELDALDVGEHRIVAHLGREELRAPDASADDEHGQRVQVKAGETTEIELVVETQSGRIAGRVVDAGEGPVPDAFVQVARESEQGGSSAATARHGGASGPPVVTDGDGRFVLERLAPGRYTLFATRKGGGEGTLEHVEVGASEIEIEIAEPGSLSGRVTLASGAAPERITVQLAEPKLNTRTRGQFFRTDGRFRFDALDPGTYELTANASEGTVTTEVVLAAGEHESDLELELAPLVEVRGRVVDLDDGTPIPGLLASVRGLRIGRTEVTPRADDPRITSAEGRFVVANATPGRVRIVLIPLAAREYGTQSVGASIPEGATDHELPTIRLAKDRLKRDERAGDLGFELRPAAAGAEYEDNPRVVERVRPGGPAAAAGLAVGATIETVDGHAVTGDGRHLWSRLTSVRPGTKIVLGLAGGDSVAIVAGKPR